MAGKREKGKIPHSEWPNIVAKYGEGRTMAEIGRDYRCTAPAIRYIVKRSGMLNDSAGGQRAGAAGSPSPQQAHADALATADGRNSSSWPEAAAPVTASPSRRPMRDHVLGPELRQRVSSDVASFLVALDHAVLEGSLDSVANLQEATDRLMRSTARTRIELEGLLSRPEITGAREKGRGKAGSQQRGA